MDNQGRPAHSRQSNERPEGITLSGEEARQGEIILRKPWQRAVFIAGLAGGAILALIAIFAR